jgi:hypothetical protein
MGPERARWKNIVVHGFVAVLVVPSVVLLLPLAFHRPVDPRTISDPAASEAYAYFEAMVPYLRTLSAALVLIGLGILAGWHRWPGRLVRR